MQYHKAQLYHVVCVCYLVLQYMHSFFLHIPGWCNERKFTEIITSIVNAYVNERGIDIVTTVHSRCPLETHTRSVI